MQIRKYKLEDKFPRNARGYFMDQDGDEITPERVLKYSNLLKMTITRAWPEGYFFNTSAIFEDLFNTLLEEVYYGLIHFSKDKAINSVGKADSASRRRSGMDNDIWLAYKKANPKAVLEDQEYSWVQERLALSARTLRSKYSDDEMHGKTVLVPFDVIQDEVRKQEMFDDGKDGNVSSHGYEHRDKTISSRHLNEPSEAFVWTAQAEEDYDHLKLLLSNKNKTDENKMEDVKVFMKGLEEDRRENLIAYRNNCVFLASEQHQAKMFTEHEAAKGQAQERKAAVVNEEE